MKTMRWGWVRVLLLGVVCFLLGRAAGQKASSPKSKSERVGLYTTEQIVWRSDRIARSLWKGAVGYVMRAEPFFSTDHAAREVKQWRVECRSTSGSPLGLLVWNADTGTLLKCLSEGVRPPYRMQVSSSQKAKWSALGYAHALGVALFDVEHLAVQQHGKTWVVRGRTERGEIEVALDRDSGLLMRAAQRIDG